MTAQEVIELAGHRDVPPWVMKLVADCVTRDRKKFAVITVDLVTRAIDLEREECAKLCEAHAKVYLFIESPIANAGWSACIDNRDAIKARGQA